MDPPLGSESVLVKTYTNVGKIRLLVLDGIGVMCKGSGTGFFEHAD